jgi:hypothetical protein
MTTMIDRSDTVADPGQETLERRTRGLWIAVIVLGVLVLGLGAWIIYDYTQDSALAPPAEVTQVVEDYTAAWNNYDGEAFLATTREGYTFTSSAGAFDRTEQLSAIENTLPTIRWQVMPLDDPIAIGDGPTWFVVSLDETTDNIRDFVEGVSVITVVEDDGSYLITRHVFLGS